MVSSIKVTINHVQDCLNTVLTELYQLGDDMARRNCDFNQMHKKSFKQEVYMGQL